MCWIDSVTHKDTALMRMCVYTTQVIFPITRLGPSSSPIFVFTLEELILTTYHYNNLLTSNGVQPKAAKRIKYQRPGHTRGEFDNAGWRSKHTGDDFVAWWSNCNNHLTNNTHCRFFCFGNYVSMHIYYNNSYTSNNYFYILLILLPLIYM